MRERWRYWARLEVGPQRLKVWVDKEMGQTDGLRPSCIWIMDVDSNPRLSARLEPQVESNPAQIADGVTVYHASGKC